MTIYTPPARKPQPLDLHTMRVGESWVYSNVDQSIHRIRAYISIAKRKHGVIVEIKEEPGSFGEIFYRVVRVR
ncbi:MAG: hypothetical protein ING29_13160 [Azospirillum sp.]|nr:hypothetical protein [Azospirillum sp.]